MWAISWSKESSAPVEPTAKAGGAYQTAYQLEKWQIGKPRRKPMRKTDKPARPAEKKPSGWVKRLSNILFNIALVVVLLSAATFTAGSGGAPKLFFGYAYFNVLTTSMQSEIPKGSFVLVKQTPARDIKPGDDITYMRDSTTSVTHRVMEVYDNYDDSGLRGFQTQGVSNTNPDPDIVIEYNVVSVVVLHVPIIGAVIAAISSNIYLVFIIFGLCMVFSFAIRGVFRKSEPETKQKTQKSTRPSETEYDRWLSETYQARQIKPADSRPGENDFRRQLDQMYSAPSSRYGRLAADGRFE